MLSTTARSQTWQDVKSTLLGRRLAAAWQQYYGEEGEQEWWLANEYSSLNSNRLDTTPDETRLRAIHHLNSLMKICV